MREGICVIFTIVLTRFNQELAVSLKVPSFLNLAFLSSSWYSLSSFKYWSNVCSCPRASRIASSSLFLFSSNPMLTWTRWSSFSFFKHRSRLCLTSLHAQNVNFELLPWHFRRMLISVWHRGCGLSHGGCIVHFVWLRLVNLCFCRKTELVTFTFLYQAALHIFVLYQAIICLVSQIGKKINFLGLFSVHPVSYYLQQILRFSLELDCSVGSHRNFRHPDR